MACFLRRFHADRTAASAAEFALVLPPFLLFLLGIFDVGRFIWFVNENEKAAQIGARWAVATDIIPGGEIGCDDPSTTTPGLRCFSYATTGITPQGGVVAEDDFPTVTCASDEGTLSCACEDTCPFSTDIDDTAQAAFNRMVRRMQAIQPRLAGDDVSISYAWSGLGYAGDPTGSDVAPVVTVSIDRLDFQPLFMAGFLSIGIPGASYSLTMEDGSGTTSN